MDEGTARGRPRDPRIDNAVLSATREILAAHGFAATTVQAVARRAGVGATGIYRRWPSRIEMIESAVFPHLDALDVTPTGDLETDLRRFADGYDRLFGSPAARAAVPGLLAAYQSEPDRHRVLAERIGQDVRPAFRGMAETAGLPPGEADAILDLLIGAALYRTFVQPFTGRAESGDYMAVLLRALPAKAARPGLG